MSAQQEKSRHSQALIRTIVSLPRRDHLVLSALVGLLMGCVLMGTTAFGMDEKD